MPLYQYVCDDCGLFESWTSMDRSEMPCECPSCGSGSNRQLAIPNFNLMNGTLRKALDRSGKSSSEPRVVSRKHLDNCGCRLCAARKGPAKPSSRWMIGH